MTKIGYDSVSGDMNRVERGVYQEDIYCVMGVKKREEEEERREGVGWGGE